MTKNQQLAKELMIENPDRIVEASMRGEGFDYSAWKRAVVFEDILREESKPFPYEGAEDC